MKAPRKVVRVEEPLSACEILRLLEACQGDRWAARDRAIILTFLDTGLRMGEIVGLRREDLHLNDGGTAWIQVYAAKTKSYRFVFLGEATTGAVVEYLAGREDALDALWVGKRPGHPVKPLEKEAIYRMVKRRAHQAGLPDDRVHPPVSQDVCHGLAG